MQRFFRATLPACIKPGRSSILTRVIPNRVALLPILALVLAAGCTSAKGSARQASVERVTIHGEAVLTDRSMMGYGYTPGAPCGPRAAGADGNGDATPLTLAVNIDGAQVYNGQTERGTGTQDATCRFAFAAHGLPTATDYHLYVGGQLTTVSRTEAEDLVTIELNGQ